jgi:hypothetical protein
MVEKQTELENPIHHICKRDLKGAPIKIFAKKREKLHPRDEHCLLHVKQKENIIGSRLPE